MNLKNRYLVIILTLVSSSPLLGALKMQEPGSAPQTSPDFSEICETDLSQVYFYGSKSPQENSPALKLFVWNTRKFENLNAFDDLKIQAETADVVFIQESAHSRDLQTTMLARLPNHRHGFYPSFCDDDHFVYGVQISTRLKSESEKLWPSPDSEPFSSIHKMSGYSLVEWNGIKIHLINTHALNFNPGGKFKEQIDDLFEKIRYLEGPVIWAGDFNTWVPMRRNYLFETAEALDLTHVVPENDNRKLKLDHVFFRGLKLKSATIVPLKTSDHFAISVEFIPPESKKSPVSDAAAYSVE